MADISHDQASGHWQVRLSDLFILVGWSCVGLGFYRFCATSGSAIGFYGCLAAWFVIGETIGNFIRRLSGDRFGIGCGGCLGLGLALLVFLLRVATED